MHPSLPGYKSFSSPGVVQQATSSPYSKVQQNGPHEQHDERTMSSCHVSSSSEDSGTANAAAIMSLTGSVVLNQRYSASRLGVPLGAIITPLPDLRAPLPVVRRLPSACSSCCAIINTYCKVDPRTSRWTCNFCGQENSDGRMPEGSTQGHPELRCEAVDYVTPEPEGSTPPPPIVALVLDVSPEADDLEALKASVLQVLSRLPRRTRLMLIAFAAAVSVFHLTDTSGIVAADVFQGHSVASPEVLQVLTEAAKAGGCIAPLHSCRAAAELAIHSIRPVKASGPVRERARCLGAAIHTALHLQRELGAEEDASPKALPGHQGMSRNPRATASGRVLVITTGPTTRGPGLVPVESIDGSERGKYAHAVKQATKFFSQLASFAVEGGITVDILAAGMSAVNTPLLSRVASESGGVLLLHQGFGPLFAANAAAALVRRVGNNGLMDFHTSKGLQITQLIGSVAALDRGPQGLIARGGSGFLHSNNAVELNVVEHGQAVGVCLEVASLLTQTHAHIQAVLGWTAEDGSSVHRVVTRRLQVSTSRGAALRGTNCEVAALLLAKRVIQDARAADAASNAREAEKLQKAIGRHLAHVAATLGEPHELPGGWFRTQRRWALPHQLRFLLEALYHLQRGPMLGSSAGHPDERALLHGLFITAAPPVALRMLAPALHLLDRASGHFNMVMPADIALWSDSAAILDHGSHIFIWLGREVAAAMPDPSGDGQWTRTTVVCERYATGLAAGRFPVPELIMTTEGASSARFVASRLIPMHRDSPEEQEAQMPVLAFLTQEQLAGLLAKQLPTEEASLLQWSRSVGVEPPPPPDNVTEALEGMALARANSMGIAGLRRAQSLADKRRQHSMVVSKSQAAARSMSVAANGSKTSLDKGGTEEV